MSKEGFKKLTTWQKAYAFGLEIYKATKGFPKEEQYGLTSQLRRAALSVAANIAEGYDRQHRKEYIQFLMIAKGSLSEVETFLLFSLDLNYLNQNDYKKIDVQRVEVAKLLRGLINSLKQ